MLHLTFSLLVNGVSIVTNVVGEALGIGKFFQSPS